MIAFLSDRVTAIALLSGMAAITVAGAYASSAGAAPLAAFTGPSDAIAVRLAGIVWEISFVFALGADLARRRRSQLPSEILRHGSLLRWVCHHTGVVAAAALAYVAMSLALVTALPGGSTDDASPAWALSAHVLTAGTAQLLFDGAVLLAALLLRPTAATPLVVLGSLIVLAVALPPSVFPAPIEAWALARIGGSVGAMIASTAVTLTAALVVLAGIALRHRIRPIDL